MWKKIISLCLMLSGLAVFSANAQPTEVISGVIQNVMPSVSAGKYDLLLSLEGQSATFLVPGSDGPKFGLTKSVTASGGPEFLQMLDDLEKIKGWKVKLTVVKTGTAQGPEYLVKSLEKISR
jgi:hypothetical protein